MPKPHPEAFRRDVVAVARKHEAPLSQIARDFGISKAMLHNWWRKADDGVRLGVTTAAGSQADEGKLYLCAIKDVYSNRIVGSPSTLG